MPKSFDGQHNTDVTQSSIATCEHEDAPRVTVDPDDPALDDDRVAVLSWCHASTHPDWPTKGFDPAAALTPETRMRMGGDVLVTAWAARQRANAPQVGTYEAAVNNMLSRMRDQPNHGRQFYLYRVCLDLEVIVLDEICPAERTLPFTSTTTRIPASNRSPSRSRMPGTPTVRMRPLRPSRVLRTRGSGGGAPMFFVKG